MAFKPESKSPPHLLIVDDDARLRELLCKFLSENGFYVTPAVDAEEAKRKLTSFIFDLIVLDIMMPGTTGLDFLEHLRKTSKVPVLLLSAKWEIDDRIRGFELGADDYLPKPFAPRELLLRLQSILRRTEPGEAEETLIFGKCTFHNKRGMLMRDDEVITLSSHELALLRAFAANRGETLTRDQLISLCDTPISPRSIDVQITRLRKKIEEDPSQPKYLQTVRHLGYVLWPD